MVWRNKEWKETDLKHHGRVNDKTLILFCLDMYARVKALETANANTNTNTNTNTEPQQQEQQQQQSSVTRDLSFTVNDGTAPIEGATVTIGAKTGTTGSAGGCTLTGVEEGTQSVEVSATGYTTKTESISVDETHTSFTISLVAEQQQESSP